MDLVKLQLKQQLMLFKQLMPKNKKKRLIRKERTFVKLPMDQMHHNSCCAL